MCGIAGFNFRDKQTVKKMADAMALRGPDDEGFYANDNVSLGHRRLSILDTSDKGHQPMSFENLIIIHNGEIYNFKSIRSELEELGYNFHSDCDTEVILYSYHKWGPACVDKFNGMWAFCIYDKKQNTFFLSRDRFGIKPLYYYFDGDKFIFASSIQAIRKHKLDLKISTEGLNFFFYQKYCGSDLTIFENCHKLKPAENLLFDLNSKKITKTKYYDLGEQIRRQSDIPLEQRLATIEGKISDAVEKRLIADVPVGSFLSGGVDSSLISAVISGKHKNFDTFSIGFKDKSYDELEYSKLVAEYIKTNHHYDYMDIDEETIKFVIENMDEPFGDASVLPTYLLSKITRGNVTVALSGDGGDEVFGGYDTYKGYQVAKLVPGWAVKIFGLFVNLLGVSDKKVTLGFKMKRFVRDFDSNINKRHLNWMATFNDGSRVKLLGERFVSSDSLINYGSGRGLLSVQLNDIENYLPEDILKKVDYASMLNSLEARVPFLDHELVPAVLSLPQVYKIKGLRTKSLLKKIAAKYVPGKIIHRGKRGFTVPISRWIKTSQFIRQVLTDRKYFTHKMLDYDYVQDLFHIHMAGKADNARMLWLIFVFNYWHHANSR